MTTLEFKFIIEGDHDVDHWTGWLVENEGSSFELCILDFSPEVPDVALCDW